MIHEISLLNRLLADLTIQSISSKSYANPHIVGKANPTPKTPIKKKFYFWEDLFIIGGGAVFINRGKGLLARFLIGCLAGAMKAVDEEINESTHQHHVYVTNDLVSLCVVLVEGYQPLLAAPHRKELWLGSWMLRVHVMDNCGNTPFFSF